MLNLQVNWDGLLRFSVIPIALWGLWQAGEALKGSQPVGMELVYPFLLAGVILKVTR